MDLCASDHAFTAGFFQSSSSGSVDDGHGAVIDIVERVGRRGRRGGDARLPNRVARKVEGVRFMVGGCPGRLLFRRWRFASPGVFQGDGAITTGLPDACLSGRAKSPRRSKTENDRRAESQRGGLACRVTT